MTALLSNPDTSPAAAPALPGTDALRLRLETDFRSLEPLREQWDNTVASLGGSVYMSYDWCKTWWDFYGHGADLRLFLFYAGDTLVSVLPLYIDRLGFGPFTFSVARLVGANVPPKVFNPALDPKYVPQILRLLLEQLFERDHCDLLSLGQMSELHPPATALKEFCSSAACPGVAEAVSGVHSIFWIPASMDEYYASLSKNERKNRRKYELRLLAKEFATRVEVVSSPDQLEQEFEHFARQHTLHWNAQGQPGHFGAWPDALDYNRALVKAQGRLGRLRFIRIVANDQVIANQYTFAFGGAYYWELPSRIVGEQWDRFSLGPTGIVTMLQAALNEGIRRLEGGLAHYDYKLRLNAKEHATRTFRITRNRLGSRFKARLFRLVKLGLEVGYHKIWYRRIRPRIASLSRRPQSRLWLRLDF